MDPENTYHDIPEESITYTREHGATLGHQANKVREYSQVAKSADKVAVRMMDALDEFIGQLTANNIDLECMADRCLYMPTTEEVTEERNTLKPCNDYTARFRTLGQLIDKQKELVKKLTEYV